MEVSEVTSEANAGMDLNEITKQGGKRSAEAKKTKKTTRTRTMGKGRKEMRERQMEQIQ